MTPSRPPAPTEVDQPAVRERAEFAGELLRWRLTARLSQADLGERMGYNRTYINKIERGALDPTAGFAQKADEALGLEGDLFALWRAFSSARGSPSPRLGSRSDGGEPAADILVEHDEAWLARHGQTYDVHMRKTLNNVGQVPVLRYFMRIAVDRFPNDPSRSNAHYRAHPLSMAELDLRPSCDDEPMDYQLVQDRDSSKEIWLLFRNAARQFPLYPGATAIIDYTFHVGAAKWGDFFQRSIRLPTRRVTVHLSFPADFEAVVWGLETSPAASQQPFVHPIETTEHGDSVTFDWSRPRPPIGARYRLQWRFSPTVDKEMS